MGRLSRLFGVVIFPEIAGNVSCSIMVRIILTFQAESQDIVQVSIPVFRMLGIKDFRSLLFISYEIQIL